MTWWVRDSRASRRPISTAARPPTPASTSSKTMVAPRLGAGEDHLERQHHARELTAGRAAADGQRRCAAVRGEPELHLVDAGRTGVQHRAVDGQRRGVRGRGRGSRTCTSSTARPIASPASSVLTAFASLTAALLRAADSAVAASAVARGLGSTCGGQRPPRASADTSILREPFAGRCRAHSSTPSTSAAYLRVRVFSSACRVSRVSSAPGSAGGPPR